MEIPSTHRWDVSPAEAIQIQNELVGQVSEQDVLDEVHWVAGVDVGFEGERNAIARAAIVVLRLNDLAPVECAVARLPVAFPYIPGLLAFREISVVLLALEKLKILPDVLLVDGQGRAHPRRLGIASHLGVLLDRPTIGCAKSILCGRAAEPADSVGAHTPVVDKGEQIGVALRTRVKTLPLYVSVGHRISLTRAIDLVLKCCTRYRLPETTRYAHRAAGGEKIVLSDSD